MSTNEQIILDRVLESEKQRIFPDEEIEESKFFDFYVCLNLLDDYDLSYDEIERGLVGGTRDGGIDGIYFLISGNLLSEDTDISVYKRDFSIDIVIVQAKRTSGFSESTIDRFIASTEDLFNLSKLIKSLKNVYNEDLLQLVEIFREKYVIMASKFPEMRVKYYYVTKGSEVNPEVERKVERLEKSVGDMFSQALFSFEFIGARGLLDLAQNSKTETLPLAISKSTISPSDNSFICMIKLKSYYNFIVTPDGNMRKKIFDANVRDYEGDVTVNTDIRDTLNSDGEEDFWWLNNGITIIARKAQSTGETITIDDAKVVNGLQTSQEIYKYFRSNPEANDDRNVLVRIIVPSNEESRNKIIKATNNQTRITAASLRATDQIQRDIELYFETVSLYYDRRKNYYKNLGKPRDKIISISFLAQAVMAMLLQEPNNSRGRPTTLIKDNTRYTRIFNSKYPIEIYYRMAIYMMKLDKYIRTHNKEEYKSQRNNIRFHVAMYSVAMEAGKAKVNEKDILSVNLEAIDDSTLDSYIRDVWERMDKLSRRKVFERSYDKVSKSVEFDKELIKLIKKSHD